jgi:cyclophilin family peptidyl-prolyl cis-trans isomerase
MRRLIILLVAVVSVIGGSGGVTVGHQIDFEVETKLLLVLQAKPVDGASVDPDLLLATARTIERRVAELGIEGAQVWLSFGDQIVVELPGVEANRADEIGRALTTTALLEIIDPRGQFLPEGTVVTTTLGGPEDGAAPASDTVYETIISGSDLQEAFVTTNQVGQEIVGFRLTDEGGERFFEYTSNNIGQPLSIVIDKRVVSTPVVNSGIRSEGLIEGIPADEVDDLVTQLNSGALAVPLRVAEILILTGIPAPPPGTPDIDATTPSADAPTTASGCWADEQRLGSGSGQWTSPPAMVIDTAKHYTTTMETNLGTFTLRLFAEDAPITVNSFVCLARAGYYDGTPFHRIIDGFVIQGGDPTGTGTGGPGYEIADEPISRDYELGTLAMANAGPDTNGSQFFIVVGVDGTLLPKHYTIFGQVTEGMDVVDRIANVPTKESEFGEMSVPVEPVTLLKVTITES